MDDASEKARMWEVYKSTPAPLCDMMKGQAPEVWRGA
jgi:hypothetical protein